MEFEEYSLKLQREVDIANKLKDHTVFFINQTIREFDRIYNDYMTYHYGQEYSEANDPNAKSLRDQKLEEALG